MRKHLPIYSVIICLSLLAQSCIKDGDLDFQNIGISNDFTYDLPLPLVDARLTMPDLLRNIPGQTVAFDSDGLLKLVYQQEFSIDFSHLGITIPNQSLSNLSIPTIPIPSSDNFPMDSISIPQSLTMPLNIPDMRVDSALIGSMNFRFEFLTGVRHPVRIVFRSSNFLDPYGMPFTTSAFLPGSWGNNQYASVPITMSGYRFIPDYLPSNPSPQITFDCTVTIFKDTTITTGYLATNDLSISFGDIDPDWIYGYLGTTSIGPVAHAIDLSIFDQYSMDMLEIESAEMILSVTNGFGLPVELDAQVSTFTHNPDNPIKTLSIDQQPLGYPQSMLEQPVTTVFHENFEELINDNLGRLPYQVRYSMAVTTNPDDDPTIQNFVSRNSFMKVSVGAEIPMRLAVAGLVVADTIAFAGLPYSEGIDEFTIRANILNGFPLEADVFLYFLNEMYEVVDSVEIASIAAGELDPEDPGAKHVTRPMPSQTTIILDHSKVRNLVDTRYFLIKGVLSTANQDIISVYEDSAEEGFLLVKIGCRIKISGKFISSFDDLFDEF